MEREINLLFPMLPPGAAPRRNREFFNPDAFQTSIFNPPLLKLWGILIPQRGGIVSSRRRRFYFPVLAALSVALMLLPAACSQGGRLTALSIFRPLRDLALSARDFARRLAPSRENEELRRTNEHLAGQVARLQNDKQVLSSRLEQVSRASAFSGERRYRLIPAGVCITTDSSPWLKSLTLSLGSRGGLRKGMAVVYRDHLVGRILETSPWNSRVQLITDPGFHAGAVAAPRGSDALASPEKRQVGVYEGTSGGKGRLKWIMGDRPVEADALVFTTDDPFNGIPAGLILGCVASTSLDHGRYQRVDVETALEFRSLEQVTVLDPEEEQTP